MSDDFAELVGDLISKAPDPWIVGATEALRALPTQASRKDAIRSVPATNNADLTVLLHEILRSAYGNLSWEAVAWTISVTHANLKRWKSSHEIEFLWAGPTPAKRIPARRIDQALYDLIARSQRDIFLVTFAAAKIERLAVELLKAQGRGVKICLVLEFEQSSEGQLSYDALKAFPSALRSKAKVYCWPVELRERNQAGKPGKLHAKMAIIDDIAIASSANMTDDAFSRNLEIGVMIRQPEFLLSAKSHIESLIAEGTLVLV